MTPVETCSRCGFNLETCSCPPLPEVEKRVPPDGIEGYRERVRSYNHDEMIAQAIGELRGFAVALRRGNSGLTANQLDVILDMATVYAIENEYL